MSDYENTVDFWNRVFKDKKSFCQFKVLKIQEDLDDAMEWLSSDVNYVLDFGCGSGTLVFNAILLNNNLKCIGIDLSEEAIKLAQNIARNSDLEDRTTFYNGGVEKLEELKENSIDGVILSNIIDNVTVEDCSNIMTSVKRILKPNGKVLVKLNPYFNDKECRENNMEKVDGNLYIDEDGLFLVNLTTDQWHELLSNYFQVEEYRDIYFEKFKQYNRLFMLRNK